MLHGGHEGGVETDGAAVITAAIVFLGVMIVVAATNAVDNVAIRNCAHELKRIADASEKSANIADRKWEP